MTEHDPSPAATHAAIGHPRHTGRFWFDFAAASAAIFISVVSLVVAIGGEHTQRELLAANAWPSLQVETDRSPERAVDQIVIRNQGVGPARIFTFEVSIDGTKMRSPADLLARCCGLAADPAARQRQRSGVLREGDVVRNVLRPDEGITMLRLATGTDPSVFRRFDAAIGRIRYEACYCSILDRCWISNLYDLSSKQVRSCPLSRHPFSDDDD